MCSHQKRLFAGVDCPGLGGRSAEWRYDPTVSRVVFHTSQSGGEGAGRATVIPPSELSMFEDELVWERAPSSGFLHVPYCQGGG